MNDDRSVIAEILAGDIDKFQILVERYHPQILVLTMGFLHCREDAEDLTQEIFIAAYLSLHAYRGEASFRTWLYRIALNAISTHLRRQSRRLLLESCLSWVGDLLGSTRSDEHDAPDECLYHDQLNALLKQAVDSLPEKQRTAFVLSRYNDLSQREVARIMQISEHAVEALLQRAKHNLQKLLARLYDR